MVTCPNCQTENRSGARFCKQCATRLATPTPVTQPLDVTPSKVGSAVTLRLNGLPGMADPPLTDSIRTGTSPLPPLGEMDRRPPGAIFGNKFIHQELLFSDGQQNRYLVKQLNTTSNSQIYACPNPACGAFFSPREGQPEVYCTDCGSALKFAEQDLILVETNSPPAAMLAALVARGLAHGNVRAPLALFNEVLAASSRTCLVLPPVAPLDGYLEPDQALRWGAVLGRSLDYIHTNGVYFAGQVSQERVGLDGDKPVWANFTGAVLDSEKPDMARRQDVRALADLIYSWLHGRGDIQPKRGLGSEIQLVFDRARSETGIASGADLARELEQAARAVPIIHTQQLISGHHSHVGRSRRLNEDSLLVVEIHNIQRSIDQPAAIYLVADGMGGHAAGDVASGTIVDCVAHRSADLLSLEPEDLEPQIWLRQAVEEANRKVLDLRENSGTDMGSTLAVVMLLGDMATFTHVGDSRIYVMNAQEIQQLTVDHSLVERLVAAQQITREEARRHPQRNVIYRTIGDNLDLVLEIQQRRLVVGDRLLLCSDGLSGMLEDETIHRIVLQASSPQEACDRLVEAANQTGGEDNITVIIIEMMQV